MVNLKSNDRPNMKKEQIDDCRQNTVFEVIQRVWGKTITNACRNTVRMEFRNQVET